MVNSDFCRIVLPQANGYVVRIRNLSFFNYILWESNS